MLNLSPVPARIASPAAPEPAPLLESAATSFEAVISSTAAPKPASGSSARTESSPEPEGELARESAASEAEWEQSEDPQPQAEEQHSELTLPASAPPPVLPPSAEIMEGGGTADPSFRVAVRPQGFVEAIEGSNEGSTAESGSLPGKAASLTPAVFHEAQTGEQPETAPLQRPSVGQMFQEQGAPLTPLGARRQTQDPAEASRAPGESPLAEIEARAGSIPPAAEGESRQITEMGASTRERPAMVRDGEFSAKGRAALELEPEKIHASAGGAIRGEKPEEKVALLEQPALEKPAPDAESRGLPGRGRRPGGMGGAKSAPGPMTTEHFNPPPPGAEQSLPSAAAIFPGRGTDVAARPAAAQEGVALDSVPLAGPAIGSAGALAETVRRAEGWSAVEAIERLQRLAQDTALEFRRAGAEVMRVVVRPDGNTELELQLSMRHGQIDMEAQVRRGDFQALSAHWPQLQQSLSSHGVRLGGLQDPGSFSQSGNGQSWTGQRQEAPPERVFMKGEGVSHSAPAPRSGLTRIVHGAGRAWETWA